ncbi:WD40 repeat domain-containing protein [Caminibacter pacificus]|uniref:WD domain G-beta repeat uncharacterized protein n=1 Tax=Caminibacter pacificus TaxID=1424653 RepID=A0AAJ4UYE2_9BACT|nr:hypothetical protein [Caminibacter pacificus]QCI28570.1 hypothetical protein C6V80_06220 [Caminibacter pacificus]ROR40703.1 WD domain G-beta repeat uncharacterized protein [Caminibacter pacificus]
MKPVRILNIKFPISLVRYIPSKAVVGVIDEKNTFRMYDIENFKLTGGFRINLPANKPLENSVAISPNGKYLAVAINGKHKTTVWEIETKKLLYTLGWHKGEVLACAFDNNDEYLITGGADGRAYMWSMNIGKMVSSLPPHADYILSCGFSKNNMWAATGSYDKLISITNVTSLNISYRKKSHRGAVTQIKFLNQRMISGDKTGELIVWNYLKGQVLNRLPNVADMVIDFDWDENEDYLFVITKDKHVYLFDLNNYELITDKFIKLGELPSSITYIPETNSLWIGTLGGSIYIFDLLQDEKLLKATIAKKEYAKAYEIVKNNPLLKRTSHYKQLEEIWEKTFSAAQKLLEKGESNKARQLFAPFLEIPSKRGIIQNILSDFADFEKFKNAVINRRYPLAYSLATMHPAFKDTVYYKKMEEDWKKVFNKAREMIKMNARDEMIKEVLKPFRGVSEKTAHIQSLFNDKQLYDLFKSKLVSKQFEDFFTLLNRYPFLYDTPEYEMAINYGKKLKEMAQKELREGNYKKAMLLAHTLEDFPDMKDVAKDIAQKAKIFSTFLNYLSQNDIDLIEKTVYDYPFLEESEDYHKFKDDIKKRFAMAESFSVKGDIPGIKKALLPLKDSMVYKNRILQVLKAAYLNQLISDILKYAKTKDTSLKAEIVKGIKNYILLFGFDNEIGDLILQMKKLKTAIEFDANTKPIELMFEKYPDFIWYEF